MKLRYIMCHLDEYMYSRSECCVFGYQIRYICNYLSKAIRKYKYETDGTYNAINVVLGSDKEDLRIINEVIDINIPFDKERYEQIKGTSDCSYYLELLRTAFGKGYPNKEIPKDILNAVVDEFEQNGCKNSWLFKRKRLKEHDLKAEFMCHFTTNDFFLHATFSKISTGEIYCSGNIFRTPPDEIHFSNLIRNVLIKDVTIGITNFVDREWLVIKIDDIKNGNLKITYIDEPVFWR